ncbi:MAG: glutamate--tRNA ligase [Chloroflexi bacterium]|nr:glutamate--tRNA ligase [Chloroflexota bacterium]
MNRPVRVRYAPSPTGIPHVGNIRTALFNWLFARHSGGSFIVRIEDTDVARRVEGAVEAILDSLRWLGMDWDEGPDVAGAYGPYFQSQRLPLYKEAAQRLVEEGNAYLCYCSTQRLEEMRAEQTRRREPPRYDRRCRPPEERDRLAAEGITPVVRFKTPLQGETVFHDLIRGDIVVDNATLDDFVLLKSDGYPTYHLANVVDDHLMEISHVMRADEWLPSTPRHVLLYRALGYQPPLYAHLPIILGPDRSKLSKRHGATSLMEYREQGYLPEAMLNFLALLGWALDATTEIFSRDDLVRHFSLDRIGKVAAIFDVRKLSWMNGLYIRQLPLDTLVERVMPFLERDLPPSVARPLSREYVARIMPLLQERLKTLAEAAELAEFFFQEELDYHMKLLVGKGMSSEASLKALEKSLEGLRALSTFECEALENLLRPLAEELGLKTGQLFGILRVATTGRTAAPPLFQTMEVLGYKRCVRRIEAAIARLKQT